MPYFESDKREIMETLVYRACVDGTEYNVIQSLKSPKQNPHFQLTRDRQQIPGNQKSINFYGRQNKAQSITKLQSEPYRNMADIQMRFYIKRLRSPLCQLPFLYIYSLLAPRTISQLIGLLFEGNCGLL